MKKKQFKFILLTVLVLLFISLLGCASNEESVRNTQAITDLQQQVAQLKQEIKQTRESSKTFDDQKYAEIQSQVDTTTGEIKAVDAKASDAIQGLGEMDQRVGRLEKEIKELNDRVTKLENSVAASKKKYKKPVPIQNDVTGSLSSMEAMYDDAYHSFTQGDYKTARKKFAYFLKKYPRSVYSDNATFWIGETYYAQGDFENAILEYEKVRRKYPHGDKVPAALLKEGLAFIKLKDKTDGRLVLKKLIGKYPHSDQARIARRILKKLR